MTESQLEEAPPRLYDHCLTVFGAMKKSSSAAMIEGKHALIYEGFLTRTFNELGLATPYYTSVMHRLRKMGCVRQLSRGGGNSPSKWELIKDPEWDAFEAAEQKKLRGTTQLDALRSEVTALNSRLVRLEDIVERMTA